MKYLIINVLSYILAMTPAECHGCFAIFIAVISNCPQS